MHCGVIAKFLYERNLIDISPNLCIALRLYLTIALTNYEAECSFLKLVFIINRLRSTQIENKLNVLTITSIKYDKYKKALF